MAHKLNRHIESALEESELRQINLGWQILKGFDLRSIQNRPGQVGRSSIIGMNMAFLDFLVQQVVTWNAMSIKFLSILVNYLCSVHSIVQYRYVYVTAITNASSPVVCGDAAVETMQLETQRPLQRKSMTKYILDYIKPSRAGGNLLSIVSPMISRNITKREFANVIGQKNEKKNEKRKKSKVPNLTPVEVCWLLDYAKESGRESDIYNSSKVSQFLVNSNNSSDA